ncbi:MAG: PLP-dependent aminotransferase family protein [Aquabacterium sp.]|nr:MAG: PLP-dependent aminotransferase family protein [Aquabacterium sp.]
MPTTRPAPFRLSARSALLNASPIRELLKVVEQPGVLSLAGGLPPADAFPMVAVRDAAGRLLSRPAGRVALQYGPSEGHRPLREWVAAHLRARGVPAQAEHVLITTGSQQALELVGKVLIDPGSIVLVESPTYLGALQAFAPCAPDFRTLEADDQGPLPSSLASHPQARLAYLVPSFQNPCGLSLGGARREELVQAASAAGVPLLEDDPYGELWLDAPPPAPLAARWSEGTIHLGSFSKMLAPGLRVGWLLAPPAVFPKLLQAKQAADLHTPSLSQHLIAQLLLEDGFDLDGHLQGLRDRLRRSRDAMQAALLRHVGDLAHWRRPAGGMFFWLELAQPLDTLALLPQAVREGVAYVPGAAFYAAQPQPHTLRLSFATLAPEQIEEAVMKLGRVLRAAGMQAPAAREMLACPV